ncbi:MAG: hypothetical protein AAFU68_08275 [Pseudomonadota bacterium]
MSLSKTAIFPILSGVVFLFGVSGALSRDSSGPVSCKWGTLGQERVYLCPEYDPNGVRVWRIVDRRPVAAVNQGAQGWYDPAYQRDLPPPPAPRARAEPESSGTGWRPRVRPRVGVGVNSSGDVGVGAGVGIGLGILDLGVRLYD